jgi:hypothetical protein
MTAKEKLLERVTKLSEAEAEETLGLLEMRKKRDGLDPWGDLDEWSDAAGEETMDMLNEEEAAIGFSWEQRSAS